MLFDAKARRAFATPGPWLALAAALVVASPHVVWLLQTDFLPFAYVSHRAEPVRGWLDHIRHPAAFAASQIFFALPSLFIAAALVWPRDKATPLPSAGREDAFDRRIVTLLAFGPALAMWGYPLWLFLGLWIVMAARATLDTPRLARVAAAWGAVFALFVILFVANYAVLPIIDHRYRAVLFPGDRLGATLTQRFRAATGQPLHYVIGSMWDGGNLAHYSPDQPQVLIDGQPDRARWIDLNALRKAGAVVVWTQGDPAQLPAPFAAIAPNAEVGAPFDLPMHRGDGAVHVGWAILKPQ
jgi:hypothetical protein